MFERPREYETDTLSLLQKLDLSSNCCNVIADAYTCMLFSFK